MASKKNKRNKVGASGIAIDNFGLGYRIVNNHPMFEPLLWHAGIFRNQNNMCPKSEWAVVTSNGEIHVHATRRGEPEEWAYVLAHCVLHLGFGHFNGLA